MSTIPIKFEELKECFDDVLKEYNDKYDVIYLGFTCGLIEYNILLDEINARPIDRNIYNKLLYETRLMIEEKE